MKKRLREKKRKIKCPKCGRLMERIGAYEYLCPCSPDAGLLIA